MDQTTNRPKPGDTLVYRLIIFGKVEEGPYRIRVKTWPRYGTAKFVWVDGPYKGREGHWDEYYAAMLLESGQVGVA